MREGKISVIVPCYNIEQYVDECVQSIVAQTYKCLEIILVDDGSVDGSGQKIDKWAQMDPRVIAVHKKNGGPGDARNYGFAISSGEYISFIDGDDFISPTYFDKLMDVLQKNDSDMSGCRFYRNNVDKEGYRYPDPDESYRFTATTEQFLERLYNDFGVFCPAWCKLYKREVIVNDMFPKVRIVEDAMVMRELAYRCKKITYIPDALYMYRERPGSIMTANREYSLTEQKERMQWIENDMAFYRNIKNNRLQALAEKALCFNISNDWKFFNKECKDYYKPRYFGALKHMVCNEGNSVGSKLKYLAFGLRMIIG